LSKRLAALPLRVMAGRDVAKFMSEHGGKFSLVVHQRQQSPRVR
jgi:hypothetical protein